MIPKIAVIWFPGQNCEHETARACEEAGMQAEIVRWNDSIEEYDGFIIQGGFAYEDRVRAGVIASKDPIMQKLRAQAQHGKPILGICNGCQILVESGLVPGVGSDVEMAVAPNKNAFVSGYYSTWVNIKVESKNAFTRLYELGEVIALPIAHGEGRFVTQDHSLIDTLISNKQIAFLYCDAQGVVGNENPNGSIIHIAGLTNTSGNVLAMMPHPERSIYMKQHPDVEMKQTKDALVLGKSIKMFESMKEYIVEKSK